jgi:hypothetical protein
MNTIEFRPNDIAPSDAEKTVYNVFVDDKFVGYVYKDWMDYWWYMVDGKKHSNGYVERDELFALIKDDL